MSKNMSIIELASEAKGTRKYVPAVWQFFDYELERFAALVRAQTLEEAAGVCETQGHGRRALEHYASLTYAGAAHDCAAAIRELKEVK